MNLFFAGILKCQLPGVEGRRDRWWLICCVVSARCIVGTWIIDCNLNIFCPVQPQPVVRCEMVFIPEMSIKEIYFFVLKKEVFFNNVVIEKMLLPATHHFTFRCTSRSWQSLCASGQNSFEVLSVRVVSQYMYFSQSDCDVLDSFWKKKFNRTLNLLPSPCQVWNKMRGQYLHQWSCLVLIETLCLWAEYWFRPDMCRRSSHLGQNWTKLL